MISYWSGGAGGRLADLSPVPHPAFHGALLSSFAFPVFRGVDWLASWSHLLWQAGMLGTSSALPVQSLPLCHLSIFDTSSDDLISFYFRDSHFTEVEYPTILTQYSTWNLVTLKRMFHHLD